MKSINRPEDESYVHPLLSGERVVLPDNHPHHQGSENGHHQPHHHHKTYWEVFFVVMPLFSGYACLFALQRQVKLMYGITQQDSPNSYEYGVAASFVYLGNLIFRLGHNIFFFFLRPRQRVILSIGAMTCSMGIITGLFFFGGDNPSLVWAFFAYACGGIGIGTFESNLLSTIAPFGSKTKVFAIIAMPTGITLITVGSFLLLETGLFTGYIFAAVLAFNLFGLFVYLLRIYREAGNVTAITIGEFMHQLKGWRHWFPHIKWHALALTFDMFFVSLFSPGLLLYLYDQDPAVLNPTHWKIKKDYLIAIYDAFFFIGDFSSRRIMYPRKIIFPLFFLILSIAGAATGLSYQALIAPLCGFMVAFANGSLYAQSNKKIDTSIDKHSNLIALSFWLFLGDIGSVCGSNLITVLQVDIKKWYGKN